jgi:hypothetical protein
MGQGEQVSSCRKTVIPTAHRAGFDFHFGSLDGVETELSKMYGGLLRVFPLFVHPSLVVGGAQKY